MEVSAPGNGQIVEYAYSTVVSGTGLLAWQTGLTFDYLDPGTTYYVHARSQQDTNYNAGAMRTSAAIQLNANYFTITVIEITDSGINLVMDSDLILSRSGTGGYPKTITISVQGSINDSQVEWWLNGVVSGSESITLSIDPVSPDYKPDYDFAGIHFITLVLEKDGTWHSKRVMIEVRE